MRIKISKCAILTIVLINLMLFVVSWKYLASSESSAELQSIKDLKSPQKTARSKVQEANKFLRKSITIIVRDFLHFDNDLKTSIDHLLNLIPEVKVLIICDEVPYPPLNIFHSSFTNNQTSSSPLIYKENVQFFSLATDFSRAISESNPLNFIHSKYVLFMPDSFRFSNGRQLLQRLVRNLELISRDRREKKIVVVPFASVHRELNYCFVVNPDFPKWSLEYEVKGTTRNCNIVRKLITFLNHQTR